MTQSKANPERPWATGVLVLAGAISLSFNTVHSVGHTHLAPPLALLFGAGPVVLAAMQSHVVALQAARGELVGGWRKARTFGLVIGALALSFLGIYDLLCAQVPDPIGTTPINEPAVILPIVVDLLAISALAELLRPGRTRTEGSTSASRTDAPVRTGDPYARTGEEPGPFRTALVRTEETRTEPVRPYTNSTRTDGPHDPVPAIPYGTALTRTEPVRTDRTRTEPARTPARTEPDEPVRPQPRTAPTRTENKPVPVPADTRTSRTASIFPINGNSAKAEWVSRLTSEIRVAAAAGRDWEPRYDAWMTETQLSRSFFEKAVRAARTEAASTGRTGGARTTHPHRTDEPRTDDEEPARTGTG